MNRAAQAKQATQRASVLQSGAAEQGVCMRWAISPLDVNNPHRLFGG